MPSTLADSLNAAAQQIIIYIGFFVLITGLLGNILNIIIFTSLNTFRETSCVVYLTMASFVNIFQLLASLLSRIVSTAYSIDLSETSLILCKARLSVIIAAALISLTCMCFVAADQYASVTIRWHHLANRRLAYRFIVIGCVTWFLHSIPVIYFSNIYQVPFSDRRICGISDTNYIIYYSRFIIPCLFGFLPILIRTIFGLLAFINVRSLARREVPTVRSRRDRQLTAMV
jgi:hypothetical protein